VSSTSFIMSHVFSRYITLTVHVLGFIVCILEVHIMIKKYWESLKANGKADLASRLDTTPGYLRQVFLYGKPVGAKLARDIERETNGVVTALELRPDLFGPIHSHSATSVATVSV
jgi:DNA-binding transcriptional regulator YdaS (Cro superfamily)